MFLLFQLPPCCLFSFLTFYLDLLVQRPPCCLLLVLKFYLVCYFVNFHLIIVFFQVPPICVCVFHVVFQIIFLVCVFSKFTFFLFCYTVLFTSSTSSSCILISTLICLFRTPPVFCCFVLFVCFSSSTLSLFVFSKFTLFLLSFKLHRVCCSSATICFQFQHVLSNFTFPAQRWPPEVFNSRGSCPVLHRCAPSGWKVQNGNQIGGEALPLACHAYASLFPCGKDVELVKLADQSPLR